MNSSVITSRNDACYVIPAKAGIQQQLLLENANQELLFHDTIRTLLGLDSPGSQSHDFAGMTIGNWDVITDLFPRAVRLSYRA